MKALVLSNDNNVIQKVTALGAMHSSVIQVISMRGSLLDAMQRLAMNAPNWMILDFSNIDINELDMLERFSLQHPQTAFILLSQNQSQELLLRAMRAGVREVLSLPIDADAFNKAIERTKVKVSGLSNRNCKVVSVIACKGGSGTTFIATNLGYALAESNHKKVLLIDLNPYFGDAALYVSEKKPSATLSDVCAQIQRIDPSLLESFLVHVTPNYSVLAASEDAAHAADIKPEHIETILQIARNHYDFIILDLGGQIDAHTVHALDNSDLIYPVLQLVLPYIRDGRRLLDIFRSLGYRRNKIQLIVNRYEKGGRLSLHDMLKVLDADVALTIPNNYNVVSDSINQGMPILKLARNSPVAKALLDLAKKLVEKDEDLTSKKSVLGKLFGH
ncbi:MAG: AAA family ATPase [Methylophilaceae bacterium]